MGVSCGDGALGCRAVEIATPFWLYLALPNVGFQNTDGGVPGLNRDFAYSRKITKPSARMRR